MPEPQGRSCGGWSYIYPVDHSGLLLEYLDSKSADPLPRDEEPAASSAETSVIGLSLPRLPRFSSPSATASLDARLRLAGSPLREKTLPAWGEVAPTEIGVPSFVQLQREQSIDIDLEVDRFVDGALAEHDGSNIDVEQQLDDPEWQTGDSLEIDLLYLEPSSEAASSLDEVELEIDIDLVTEEEQLRLEVEIAQSSDSHIWEGLDGECGVFLATYQTLPIGTHVQLTVHLMDRAFSVSATVRWMRDENTGIWPGLGLEFDVVTVEVAKALERFAQIRPAMFHSF